MSDRIVLDGRAFVAEDSLPRVGASLVPCEDGGWRIVVLQRGHVVVGHYRRFGSEVVIANASVIRRWGTTRGLGQLAEDGKQASTVLDPAGEVRCHELAVVLTIRCTHASWRD